MTAKLCFNCFKAIDLTDEKCGNCGVEFVVEKKDPVEKVTPKSYFEEELRKLKDLETGKKQEEMYIEKHRPRDLIWLVVFTSILGIFQISTSWMIDSINVVSLLANIEIVLLSYHLTISGFLYFICIPIFYKKFYFIRRLYLIGNLIHIFLLFRIYQNIDEITKKIESGDHSIPDPIPDFISPTSFGLIMLLFGLLYVLQIGVMYRRELLNIRLGR